MILTVCKHIPADEVRLYGFSDWHLGSAECDEKLIAHDINMVQDDENARVVILGDLLQTDFKTSKGDVYNQKYTPSQQRKLAREMLEPIKYKILSMQGGNHDELRSQEDATPIQDIAEWLGLPYLAGETLLKIPIGEKARNKKPCVYTFFGVHGWANGRMMGGKVNNLDRLKDIVPIADIYGIGHTHTQHVHKDVCYIPDLHNNNVIEKVRYFINFGSYQGRGMYPKSKAMPGVCLGTPTIRLCGTEKKVTIEI